MLTRGRAVSPSFACGDLPECPLCVPYRSLRVAMCLNPRLSGGGGTCAFSSPNAPVVGSIVAELDVLKND
jgi:hypothetical protein